MNRLKSLQLERAALRLEIAVARAAATESAADVRSSFQTAAWGVAIWRVARALSPRWRTIALAALAAAAAIKVIAGARNSPAREPPPRR